MTPQLLKQAVEMRKVAMEKEAIGARAMRIAKMFNAARQGAGAPAMSRGDLLRRARRVSDVRSSKGMLIARPESEIQAGIQKHVGPLRTGVQNRSPLNSTYVDNQVLARLQRLEQYPKDAMGRLRPLGSVDRHRRISNTLLQRKDFYDKLLTRIHRRIYHRFPTELQLKNLTRRRDRFDRLQELNSRALENIKYLPQPPSSPVKQKSISDLRGKPVLPDAMNPVYPLTRYKGWKVRDNESIHSLLLQSRNSPVWYSPHQQVSSGYATGKRGRSTGILAMTTEPQLRKFGPIGPPTPHISTDTRGLSLEEIKSRDLYPSSNSDWTALPDYEQVATMPSRRQFARAHAWFKLDPQGNAMDINRAMRGTR